MSSKTKKNGKKKKIIFPPMSALPYNYGIVMRIYPSCEQKRIIDSNIDAGRWFYNKLVEWGKKRLPKTNGNFPIFDVERNRCDEWMSQKLTIAKAMYGWLNNEDLDSLTFVNAKRTYNRAWENCKKLGTKPPKFHSKTIYQSYQTSCLYQGPVLQRKGEHPDLSNGSVRFENDSNFIVLPKVGRIRYACSDELVKRLKKLASNHLVRIGTVTIRKTPTGEYCCSMQLASDAPFVNGLPKIGEDSKVGIDLNLSNFLTDSDGNVVDTPKFYRLKKKDLAKAQHKQGKKLSMRKRHLKVDQKTNLTYKQKRSAKNYQKQCIKVAEIHKKIMNQRKDFLEKLSLWYIKNHDVIVAEELRSKNLLKNHKLALSIQDSGWRTFLTMLERKAAMYGKTFVTVNPKNTTQTCSHCGHVMRGKEKIGLGVEEWTCPKCGTHHIRDYNAAKNILSKGLQVLAPAS